MYAACTVFRAPEHMSDIYNGTQTLRHPTSLTPAAFLLAEALLLTEMMWGCRFCATGNRNATPLATRHRHASSSTALA